jgi:phage shock protein A
VDPHLTHTDKEDAMRTAEAALLHFVSDAQGSVVELRRDAVTAVVRQQRIREELSRVRPQAAWIEERASRALARGEELRGRQILADGLCTLEARDALEAELREARERLTGILTALVRAENRVWRRPGDPSAIRKGGGAEC